jgi:tetratricopeptide (TPR) repeat protein
VTAPVADAICHARAAATSSQRTEWLVALGIALACVVVFANALPNAFVLDDQFRVVNNPGIQRFWPPWRHFTEPRTMSTLESITQYRPLLPLTLSVNYAVSGDSGVGYHLGNLALQIAASLLGFFLCLELLSHWSAVPLARSAVLVSAGFAALLFAVHPVSGIAVNYISARDLLLMQVFSLGMLLAYARMRRLGETAARWAVVIALLALSLLAKTNLVVAPLILLAFDLILARTTLRDRLLWRRAGLAAGVVAAFFVVTQLALGFSDLAQVTQAEASPLQYGLTQARLHLFHYLPHFVWPFPIRLLPSIDPGRVSDYRVWLGLLFVVAAVGLAWRYRRTAPIVAFCVIAYWILMIPESSVLPLYQAAVDYRPYAGSLFLFLAVATVLVAVCGEGLAALVLAGFSVYIGAASIAANAHWRTAERLWSHSVAYGGDAVAHLNLAMSIADRRDPRVRAELEESVRREPNYALAHIDLCILQLELGETAAGLERCEYAARIAPSWPQSHYWLAFAYRRLGRAREAAAASARAAEIDPDNLRYPYEAARDAQAVQDWAASLRLAELVRQRDPDYQEITFVHGVALQMLGRTQEAIAEYAQFLRTHPEHAPATLNTGYALASLGRCSEAIPYFERTLALRPGDSAAQRQLDRCRSATSR